VRLEEARVFLELDDAALLVRAEQRLRVTGEAPVAAPPGEALLALPIPPGAQEVRFDRGAFELGLAADGHGGAALEGPLPPGESTLELAYHLPADPRAGTVLDLRFGTRLPLLSVFVADTGVRLESERLHRRRPVATTDRTFAHLEAFEVGPEETVRLAVAPLERAARPPRALLYGVVALAAAAAAAFLGAPLRGGRGAVPAEIEAEGAGRREREAVYAALRDLEHDHETGKVADADYAMMRQELRARAAALLREEEARGAPAARPESLPSTLYCVACGAVARSGDRFCAHCGARLSAAGPAPESEARA
jgi:hypothetical protein